MVLHMDFQFLVPSFDIWTILHDAPGASVDGIFSCREKSPMITKTDAVRRSRFFPAKRWTAIPKNTALTPDLICLLTAAGVVNYVLCIIILLIRM